VPPSELAATGRHPKIPAEETRESLQRFAWVAREALDASACLITLVDRAGNPAPESRPSADGPISNDPAAGRVVQAGETIALAAGTMADKATGLPDGYVSYLGAPIRLTGKGDVLGVLAVFDERSRTWSDRDRQLLSRLAEATAADLASSGIAIELEKANDRLERASAELDKERVQLREMIRMSPAFIASVEGPHAIFTMANDPFYDLVGPRNLIGLPLREALPEIGAQGIAELVGKVYTTGQSLGGDEVHIRLRRGENGPLEDRFVSFVYQPLMGPQWQVTGVLVCGVDLTEQVLARKAAEASATDFRLMAETIRQVFWVADAAGDLLYISPAAEAVWGCSAEKILAAKGWMDTIAAEDQPRIAATYIEERVVSGTYDTEYRIVRPDGNVRWIRDRAYPVRDEAGEIDRIVGIAEDVTDRRALEMQLRQSQKMEAIGRLAGGIAHDFNNMLTAIGGHAQLLEGELPRESPLHQHIEIIRMAADRSAALTRQLLAFSRKQILQPRVVELNAVIASIEPMLRRMIGEDIEVRTALQPDIPPIFADPSQIEQVLMNLIVNARDAMPAGGKLTLTTAEAELSEEYFTARQVVGRPGRYAMLAVSDNGVGMDPIIVARIFEPFFTTKPAGKGTGLGLSTVYGIVKQTQGFVWVYSEPGQGSTFKVYLPLARQVDGRDAASRENEPYAAEIAATVLVVEDDPSVRSLVTRVLQRAGYEVLQAAEAGVAAALATDYREPIDLLITDVVLPSMNGPAVADLVCKAHPETQVLFMSGYTDEAIVHHEVLAPGTEFLEKPFTPRQLLGRVQEILRRRERS
jgi:two-component system, cell cycle sensor histidine kinase and response regulator CckA